MEDFEKGAKRKGTQCSTLFFDFGKFPTICPNCGYELTSLLTNVSKRGRPPKKSVPEVITEEKEIKLGNYVMIKKAIKLIRQMKKLEI